MLDVREFTSTKDEHPEGVHPPFAVSSANDTSDYHNGALRMLLIILKRRSDITISRYAV